MALGDGWHHHDTDDHYSGSPRTETHAHGAAPFDAHEHPEQNLGPAYALDEDTLTCAAWIIGADGLTERVCRAPAPTHGIELHQDGMSQGRRPLCDEHYEAMRAGGMPTGTPLLVTPPPEG